MIKHSPGKGRRVFSVGAGACTFVDGKPVLNPPKGLTAGVLMPFSRLDSKTWLHDRAEADVYKLLIDTYRLRVVQEQRDHEKPEYSEDPINGFKAFLKLFGDKRELLPGSWAEQKAEECVKVSEGEGWSPLHRMILKNDVNAHYGEPRLGLQLRLFGEQVYDTAPAGRESGFHDEF